MDTHQDKTRSILQHIPLFQAVDTEALEQIAEKTEEIRLNKQEMLFQSGEIPAGFFIVAYGQIKLTITSPMGDEKIVEIIGPRQSFGEAVMFLKRPYPVSSVALMDSLILRIPLTVVDRMLEQDQTFAKRMLAGLSARLHSLLQDVESYSMHSGAQRVISYLLLQCHDDCGEEIDITLPTSKLVIASRLNLTPETLSRVLQDLSRNQLIVVHGRNIQIPSLTRLREFMR